MLIYIQMIESEEDKSKFEQLYLKYRWLMYSVAKSILNNEHDAEDAVHQAFLSILVNLQKIHKADCPETKSYIVIITERKAIDILRARKHITSLEFEEELSGIEITLPIDGGLADAIARLPARYREVILLRYAYGYTTKEIGKMLGRSQETVQRLLYRAKAALQNQLEKDGAVL